MSHNDFEFEPVPGLPAKLPEDEHLVWQGSPDRSAFARSVLHVRIVMGYFALLIGWKIITGFYDGGSAFDAATAAGQMAVAALIVFAIIYWYSRAVSKSTIYTITNRRILMRIGVALPVTFNFPFSQIETANVKPLFDDKGNITIGLKEHTKISWAILWPHARPWKLAQPEPAMRTIRNIEGVAGILRTELHAFHNLKVPVKTTIPEINQEAIPVAEPGLTA